MIQYNNNDYTVDLDDDLDVWRFQFPVSGLKNQYVDYGNVTRNHENMKNILERTTLHL